MKKRLLIADDSEINRAILANMLEQDFDIIEAANGREAIIAMENYGDKISALLLDVVMPEMNGFEVLDEMKKRRWIEEIPTVMISAETSSAYIDRAFELGASDYISRPFTPGIIRHRVINTILLHAKKQQITDTLAGWFYKQEKSNEAVASIFGYVLEQRCGESGMHMLGVSRVTNLLLNELVQKTDKYKLDASDIDAICKASELHDIGKFFIDEKILKKPGKLTDEEFNIVKTHTVIGAKIIENTPAHQNKKIIKYAAQICRWHHERWSGEGYPDGLSSENIPIAAQVVSLADVYDALTNDRSYKKAYSHKKALEMIRGGECGSFNPLLLKCLDEIADTLRAENTDEGSSPKQHGILKSAEDKLYRRQNSIAARMTQQFEYANIKQEFMVNMCGEIWFEYTSKPSQVRLSRGAVEKTGLADLIENPADNDDFIAIVGHDTIEEIETSLDRLTTDETYIEVMAKILLGGKLCRCQMAILVLWSSSEHGKVSTLLGKVIDIDEGYNRLEDYDKALSNEPPKQILLPVVSGEDDVIKITKDKIPNVIEGYKKLFEKVRLVDPGICMQVCAEESGHRIEKSEHCYSIWGKTHRCENCISQEAIRTRKKQSKIETAGDEVYYIIAICAEIDNIPYSLECVSRIYANDLKASDNENILNQLLVRNRQVYIDSTTKVFNRRYYDTRIRNLTGEHALAMIDIDNFKQINDTFGHMAGDTALHRVAQSIRSILRSNDELIRYGGDEFFILFNSLQKSALDKKLQEICIVVRSIEIAEYPKLHLTASIGGAYGAGRISEIIKNADNALYQAKVTKNCAVVFKEDLNDC